jgi:glycosyltransferase involved in cell wall biosynthesis
MSRDYGGPVAALESLRPALEKREVHVDIACSDAPAKNASADPHVVQLGPGLGKFGSANYGYTPRLKCWLLDNVRNYDVVVVHGIWQFHSLAARDICSRLGVPYVVFVHGALDPWFKRTYPLKHLKKLLYWPWADYRVLRDAAAVLYTCEEEMLLARQSFWLYKARERIINYGTVSPPNPLDAMKAAFFSRFPQLRGRRILLYLSRIHEKKGCDLAIRAFARVGISDNILIIAGPNESQYARSLRRLTVELGIADRVLWAGMLSGDVKYGAFAAADIFILPSHTENFGIAVVEALGCGLPVLISDKVNIYREIISDRVGLVETDTLDGTIELLRRWYKLSPDDQANMRLRARESFLNRFEIGQTASGLIDIMNEVCAA